MLRVPRNGPLACSFAQERIWHSSRSPSGAGYVMVSEMRIRGRLDVDSMRRAIQHTVMGNEILSTTFIEREGRLLQMVGTPLPIDLPLIALGDGTDPEVAVGEQLRLLAREPLDLERGPLLRLLLVRVSDDDHRLLRVNHHIVSDAMSWRIFFKDVARGYEAHRRGDPMPAIADRAQYADFAAWERERLHPDGARYRDQVEWWRRAFQPERPVLRLPFSRAAPARVAAPADGVVRWEMEPDEMDGLDELARRDGATSFAVRLAVFAALLGLETGQEEILLGTYAMNRRVAETQSMFGFFSNPITLILPFDQKLSFRRWLAVVRRVVIDAKARSEIPYDRMSEELRRRGTQPHEINAMFTVRDRWPRLRFAGIEICRPKYTVAGMPWGFSFNVDRTRENPLCSTMFDARIYDPGAVREFVERYRNLARRIVEKPDRRLQRLRP